MGFVTGIIIFICICFIVSALEKEYKKHRDKIEDLEERINDLEDKYR